MNKHLEPVFKTLLPELEKAEIDYWVYGGVGIAAFVGEFIRINNDVDIFVRETDFQNAKLILDGLCKQNNFKLVNREPLRNGRPKFDIIIDKKRLSVVPVYPKDDFVEFRFARGLKKFPSQILEKIERNISGYRFFTPPNKYIKEILLSFLTLRHDKLKTIVNSFKGGKGKEILDASAILTTEELKNLSHLASK